MYLLVTADGLTAFKTTTGLLAHCFANGLTLCQVEDTDDGSDSRPVVLGAKDALAYNAGGCLKVGLVNSWYDQDFE